MRAEINLIIHATESEEKILSSIKKTLNVGLSPNKIKRSSLSGHYGNPITYITIRLTSDDIKRIFYILGSELTYNEKIKFLRNLDDYLDRSTLYMRIDKQKLCKGEVSFVEEDPIKIVIKNVNPLIIKKWLKMDDQ